MADGTAGLSNVDAACCRIQVLASADHFRARDSAAIARSSISDSFVFVFKLPSADSDCITDWDCCIFASTLVSGFVAA